VLAACQPDPETEPLHEELHHPLRTVHRAPGPHGDVSEKSFQPRGHDPKSAPHANFGGPKGQNSGL